MRNIEKKKITIDIIQTICVIKLGLCRTISESAHDINIELLSKYIRSQFKNVIMLPGI